MPMYDYQCRTCEKQAIDVLAPVDARQRICDCGALMDRVWLQRASAVIGDECDIWMKNGLCNEDGSPRRYTSKAEIAQEARRRGLVNRVEHVASPGSDKNRSSHTTRWV